MERSTFLSQMGAALASPAHCAGILAPGSPVPDVRLPQLDGGTFTPAALRGYGVWINWFATWCGPCYDEMPQVVAASKRYAADGLRVIGIDFKEPAEKVRRFAGQMDIEFPIALDSGSFAKALKIAYLPVSIFVNRAGLVTCTNDGAIDVRTLASEIATTLRSIPR